jgi:hypothetical protein
MAGYHDRGHAADGALRLLLSMSELHLAAVAKTHFDSTLRRMQLDQE